MNELPVLDPLIVFRMNFPELPVTEDDLDFMEWVHDWESCILFLAYHLSEIDMTGCLDSGLL